MIKKLLASGEKIRAYDPVAMTNMSLLFPDITYCKTYVNAVRNADACIVLTEWKEFLLIDWKVLSMLMRQRIVIDMRDLLDKSSLEKLGFDVYGV